MAEHVAELQGAVLSGDGDAVRAALARGADANAPFADGSLPLYAAAKYGFAGVCVALVRDGGAQPDALSPKLGASALAVAAWKGRAAVAGCLIELLADPNGQSRAGSTALYMAAKFGHAEVIRELLRASGHPAYAGPGEAVGGARMLELELSTAKGQTPLLRAAYGGHLAAVQLLLEAAADPNGVDMDGFSPLCAAASASSVPVAHALLGANADADQQTYKGTAPLLLAGTYYYVKEVEKADLPMVELLLGKGAAEADVCAQSGQLSAVWFAHRTGQAQVAERLLEARASLDGKLADGGHLLAACCQRGYAEDVRWLLKHGVRADLPTNDFLLPLQLGAAGGHAEVVKLLLAARAAADPPAAARGGGPAAHSALSLAAQGGHATSVALLIGAKASVEWRAQEGAPSALWLACLAGHEAVARALLEAGTAVDPPPSDAARRPPRGRSALWAAAAGGHAALLETLASISLPADRVPLYLRADEDGLAPLALAAALGHEHAVRALLHLGSASGLPAGLAECELPCGATALAAATNGGHVGAMAALLEAAVLV
ncbi:ankyrin repeat-containing domain protein [Pavlovales sp. CCMP2436]|nr:ankyrin repeat-containing domain protein [Pavlovales sp. CCMP2436]